MKIRAISKLEKAFLKFYKKHDSWGIKDKNILIFIRNYDETTVVNPYVPFDIVNQLMDSFESYSAGWKAKPSGN